MKQQEVPNPTAKHPDQPGEDLETRVRQQQEQLLKYAKQVEELETRLALQTKMLQELKARCPPSNERKIVARKEDAAVGLARVPRRYVENVRRLKEKFPGRTVCELYRTVYEAHNNFELAMHRLGGEDK